MTIYLYIISTKHDKIFTLSIMFTFELLKKEQVKTK